MMEQNTVGGFCKRELWGDIAKGFAIILVIIGHSLPPDTILCKFIFLFHMPVFFFLSGYFLNFTKYENKFSNYFKNIMNRLFLPCVFTFLLTLTKPFIVTGISSIVHSLWFLLCLICVKILLWTFLKITYKLKLYLFLKILLLLVFAQIGANLGQIIRLPFSFDVALVAVYISYIGYLTKEYNLIHKRKFFIILFPFAIFFGYIGLRFLGLDMNNRFYSHYPLLMINISIIMSLMLIYFCKIIEKIPVFNLFLAYLGINSLCIMIFHTVAYSTYSFIACFSIRLAVSILIVEIISFIPFIKNIYGAKSIRNVIKQYKKD